MDEENKFIWKRIELLLSKKKLLPGKSSYLVQENIQ
jgi:hypothetical protein